VAIRGNRMVIGMIRTGFREGHRKTPVGVRSRWTQRAWSASDL
jgi:hypothetical protein